MKSINVFFVVVISLLIASSSSAQTKQNFAKANTWEVGGSLSYSYIQNVSNGRTDDGYNYIKIFPYAGYFVTDGFEIGVIPALELISSGGSTATNFAIYAAPSYNFFTKSNAYPYIQGAFGFNSVSYGGSSSSRSGIAWAIEGGVKINVSGNSLLKVGFDYEQKTLNKSNSTGDRSGLNTFSFVAGFNVFFN